MNIPIFINNQNKYKDLKIRFNSLTLDRAQQLLEINNLNLMKEKFQDNKLWAKILNIPQRS